METVQVLLPISRLTPTEFHVTGGSNPQLRAFGEHISVGLAAAGDAQGNLDEQDAAAAEALLQAVTEYRNAVRARVADQEAV
ncbi:hypothetical protein [Salinifilum ghardaiensis]